MQASYPSLVVTSFGEMRNVSMCGPIWFGTMPCAGDLELARRRGIDRVIDLGTPDEQGECSLAAVCNRLGLEYLNAGLRTGAQPNDEAVDLVMVWLSESHGAQEGSEGEILRTLMVDGSGGRSATFVAIYRTLQLGVPLEEALIEARRAGMKPGEPESFVRAQVERISAFPPTGF